MHKSLVECCKCKVMDMFALCVVIVLQFGWGVVFVVVFVVYILVVGRVCYVCVDFRICIREIVVGCQCRLVVGV